MNANNTLKNVENKNCSSVNLWIRLFDLVIDLVVVTINIKFLFYISFFIY